MNISSVLYCNWKVAIVQSMVFPNDLLFAVVLRGPVDHRKVLGAKDCGGQEDGTKWENRTYTSLFVCMYKPSEMYLTFVRCTKRCRHWTCRPPYARCWRVSEHNCHHLALASLGSGLVHWIGEGGESKRWDLTFAALSLVLYCLRAYFHASSQNITFDIIESPAFKNIAYVGGILLYDDMSQGQCKRFGHHPCDVKGKKLCITRVKHCEDPKL